MARATFDAKTPSEKARVEERSRGVASFLPAFIPPVKKIPAKDESEASQSHDS